MDIKKEFESSLKTRSMQEFFQKLTMENPPLRKFASLTEMIEAVNDKASDNYRLKDACLLSLIKNIQQSVDKEAGLNLLTYLLASGLQRILRDSFRPGDDLGENWSEIWWTFLQMIERFSITTHRKKVAGILLRKTLAQVLKKRARIFDQQSQMSPIEESAVMLDNIVVQHFLTSDNIILEKIKEAEIDSLDFDVIIASRLYGESLEAISRRLGLNYSLIQRRRNRAEQKLKKIINNKN